MKKKGDNGKKTEQYIKERLEIHLKKIERLRSGIDTNKGQDEPM